jgi:Rrf2 family protein
MKLGKESRYAIEGLVVLAKKPLGTTMQLRDIAVAAGVPSNFLAKIFQKLARANILASSRGAVRGYAIARRPNAITMKMFLSPLRAAMYLIAVFFGAIAAPIVLPA